MAIKIGDNNRIQPTQTDAAPAAGVRATGPANPLQITESTRAALRSSGGEVGKFVASIIANQYGHLPAATQAAMAAQITQALEADPSRNLNVLRTA